MNGNILSWKRVMINVKKGGGQLGLGHTERVSVPTKINLSVRVKRVRCGFNHTILYCGTLAYT